LRSRAGGLGPPPSQATSTTGSAAIKDASSSWLRYLSFPFSSLASRNLLATKASRAGTSGNVEGRSERWTKNALFPAELHPPEKYTIFCRKMTLFYQTVPGEKRRKSESAFHSLLAKRERSIHHKKNKWTARMEENRNSQQSFPARPEPVFGKSYFVESGYALYSPWRRFCPTE